MNNIPENNGQVNIDNSSKKKSIIRTVAVVLSVVFCLLTAGTGVFSFISEDREFSESENRVLSSVPLLTWEGILNGSFMKDFETYLSDQFPFRDEAIEVKTFAERLVGKREQNGVFIGDKGFLFDSQTDYIKKDNEKKLESINTFSKKNHAAKQIFALSPNSSYVYGELMPYGKKQQNQQIQIDDIYSSLKSESIKKLDVSSVLFEAKEKGLQLFYKTDHHWTTRAAYEVFCSIAREWKLNENVNYSFYTVSDSFEGTLSGKAGIHDVKDAVEICVPENSPGAYTVTYETQQRKTATVFDEAKLSNKNKYEVFLGGNFDKVIINTSADTRNTLLIVKDSFANCMIPMFTPYFTKIVIVDPRYMTESINSVISETDFSHILFLYNLNTFLGDTSIVSAFGEE